MTKRVIGGGFAVWVNGAPRVYPGGELVADDDPILKTHGQLFADVSGATRTARGVEAATAGPGELRTLTAPRQAADTPPAAPGPGAPFDPGTTTVKAVLAYLGDADRDEAVRVLDAEADGQKRAGILGQRDDILARTAAS